MKLRDKDEIDNELREIKDSHSHQLHALNIRLYKRIVALLMMVIAAPVMAVGLTKVSVAITGRMVMAAILNVAVLVTLITLVSVAIFHLLYD